MVEDGNCRTEEGTQNVRTELDRQDSEETSENALVPNVGCRRGAMVGPLSYADFVKGNRSEKVQEETNVKEIESRVETQEHDLIGRRFSAIVF